jgi:hypothetical protein
MSDDFWWTIDDQLDLEDQEEHRKDADGGIWGTFLFTLEVLMMPIWLPLLVTTIQ